MKKLEDIPKKDLFNVPEGYFEALPGIIQARVASKRNEKEYTYFLSSLKYALPLVILLIAGVFWFNRSSVAPSNVDSMLSTVQTEDLMAYLNESDLTTEELLESVDFNASELAEIEKQAYDLNISDKDFEETLDKINLTN